MKTETTLTFNSMSRELLEAELNRCNDIMVVDGQRIGALKAQRDELLAALEELLKHDANIPDGADMTIDNARAAIAACKAGGKDGGK